MSNKKNGTVFEQDFAKLLAGYGFWVHLLQDNRNGQPFDVIAAKAGETYVFDCKDCQNGVFPLNRIEENQECAMRLWQECGNREGMFALKFPSGIRMLSYTTAMELIEIGHRRLSGFRIRENTVTFEEWINENYNQ